VRFSRQLGHAVADLEVQRAARSSLPALHAADALAGDVKSRIALVSDYDAADRVPEGWKFFWSRPIASAFATSSMKRVMLALPHVARHEEGSECAGGRCSCPDRRSTPRGGRPQVQKPFAQLGELLKRK
jgi:hypothetical protein